MIMKVKNTYKINIDYNFCDTIDIINENNIPTF